jgi:hypothetical protein
MSIPSGGYNPAAGRPQFGANGAQGPHKGHRHGGHHHKLGVDPAQQQVTGTNGVTSPEVDNFLNSGQT